MKTIGEKLRLLREETNLSQKQLCSYLNIDQTYLSKMESNERPISIVLLDKLAILYGIKLSDFDLEEITINPINYSMRQKDIDAKDLQDIANINIIASNSAEMSKILEKYK